MQVTLVAVVHLTLHKMLKKKNHFLMSCVSSVLLVFVFLVFALVKDAGGLMIYQAERHWVTSRYDTLGGVLATLESQGREEMLPSCW